MRTHFLLKNHKTKSHRSVGKVPEWVIFLLKKQMLRTTHFSWKTYVLLMASAVQIVQKFQVKPNQQCLSLTFPDPQRITNTVKATCLPSLFPSYSNLQSRKHEFASVLCCSQVTEPLKPNRERKKNHQTTQIFSIMYSFCLHPHLLQMKVSYKKKGNFLLLWVQQDPQ